MSESKSISYILKSAFEYELNNNLRIKNSQIPDKNTEEIIHYLETRLSQLKKELS